MKTRKKTRGKPFKPGNQAAVGNEGGGRPPDWLKKQCQEIIERNQLLGFLGNVARGEIAAGMKERLRATEMLLDRAYGKPSQGLEIGGNVNVNIHRLNEELEAEGDRRGV